jgi:hypothetical protein
MRTDCPTFYAKSAVFVGIVPYSALFVPVTIVILPDRAVDNSEIIFIIVVFTRKNRWLNLSHFCVICPKLIITSCKTRYAMVSCGVANKNA